MKPSSAKDLNNLLKEFSVAPLKRLGQNFLIDDNVLGNIAASAGLDKEDAVLEIGPGAGALTRLLCRQAGRVAAVEVDSGLIPLLRRTLADFDNVTLIEGDILADGVLDAAAEALGRSFKVVANLPYYITTPVLMLLLESRWSIRRMVLMVQREVAERLCAAPGTKAYGVLTVAAAYYADAEVVMKVAPGCFMPRPDVESAVVRLTPREDRRRPLDTRLFFRTLRAAFAMRRKTLWNNLAAPALGLGREGAAAVLAEAGIEAGRRGETLGLEEFIQLSDAVYKYLKNSL